MADDTTTTPTDGAAGVTKGVLAAPVLYGGTAAAFVQVLGIFVNLNLTPKQETALTFVISLLAYGFASVWAKSKFNKFNLASTKIVMPVVKTKDSITVVASAPDAVAPAVNQSAS